MTDKHDLELLIRGHTPIIKLDTHEENRALDLLNSVSRDTFLPSFKWTVTDGLQRLDIDLEKQRDKADPQDVLRYIKASNLQAIYILLDFTPYLSDPVNIRLIKEIAMKFDGQPGKLVLISHQLELPPGLSRMTVKFQLKLPNNQVLETLIQQEAALWQQQNNSRIRSDRKTLDRLIQNLSGLSFNDAKHLIRNAIVDDGAITESDLPEVMQAKYQLLNRDEILAFEFETAHFSEVGGMGQLKQWLMQRHAVFQNPQDLPPGLDRPKGILLLGVQGCGKSLAAKAVAGIWGLPLLRLDFGRLYDKYVGETERNLRQALQTAEVMAPCVLWIDELEKGISSSNEDEGTSKRILATLLTWMAENKHAVFIVATANQIDSLPPELIRKGRLDEIFFVDLPDQKTREQIFHIHLKKREIDMNRIDTSALAQSTKGFSGSEIEQAVVAVCYASFASQQSIDTEALKEEIRRTRPLSMVMAEQINQLRTWAKQRTVPVN
ncbi:MAG: AAA family ATPase [Gammaproteobacteria bacterium]|nr:AAA family ATPase [Gammaproteobacteria bacterium]